MTEQISSSQARRIALAAQGFAQARPTGLVGHRHLRKVMARLQLLQLDSVPVVVRTQYMPIFSRLGSYREDLLDEIAYREDEWFEAWSHEASLLPVEMEPWLRWSKHKAREGETWRNLYTLAKSEPKYIESVLQQVRDRGPLCARDLEDSRPRSGDWWGSRSGGTIALDWLYRTGEVGIRRTRNFAKQFDLLERIVPPNIRARPTPSFEASLDELLIRSARAHGIASADCLVDYFRLPVRPAKSRLDVLVAEGKLAQAVVEGWSKPAYRHPDSRLPRQIRASALLSPFDPVVWNRKRIAALFHFEYRIEIYTPVEKRKFGYYVLPFLMGDRLVARFDLKMDRKTRTLCVLAAHIEVGAKPLDVAAAAASELNMLSRFLSAERVQVGRRGNLATALRREVAALKS